MMVTEEEIRRVSGLMRIEIEDFSEYADKVRAMIEYFEILDSASVESEEISMPETDVAGLRDDEHVPFDGDLAGALKLYRGGYVRAPKMP